LNELKAEEKVVGWRRSQLLGWDVGNWKEVKTMKLTHCCAVGCLVDELPVY
jgi:hypothetical protein